MTGSPGTMISKKSFVLSRIVSRLKMLLKFKHVSVCVYIRVFVKKCVYVHVYLCVYYHK